MRTRLAFLCVVFFPLLSGAPVRAAEKQGGQALTIPMAATVLNAVEIDKSGKVIGGDPSLQADVIREEVLVVSREDRARSLNLEVVATIQK